MFLVATACLLSIYLFLSGLETLRPARAWMTWFLENLRIKEN